MLQIGRWAFVLSRCSAREIPILSDELQIKNAVTGARKSDGSDAFK